MEERKSEEEKLHRQKNKIHFKLKLITLSIIRTKKKFHRNQQKKTTNKIIILNLPHFVDYHVPLKKNLKKKYNK